MTIIRRTLGLKSAAVQKPESVQVHPPPPQPVFRLREKETLAYFGFFCSFRVKFMRLTKQQSPRPGAIALR
jgi:hypothetical protein